VSLPEFPKTLPTPDSIKESRLCILNAQDLCDKEAFVELAQFMFSEPEIEFYLFLEKGQRENAIINQQLKACGIIVCDSEFYYYLVPGSDNHYMKIRDAEHPRLNEIKNHSKHYFRERLQLSDSMKRHLNNKELVLLQKMQPREIISVNPGLWGITINLKELFKRVKKWFWKN